MALNAAIPGFALVDHVKASATDDLCATHFERDLANGGKKTEEKIEFDQKQGSAHRVTTVPKNGGETTFSIAGCARDALTYLYYAPPRVGARPRAAGAKCLFRRSYTVPDGLHRRAERHRGRQIRP